jgi:hypothetical protein
MTIRIIASIATPPRLLKRPFSAVRSSGILIF